MVPEDCTLSKFDCQSWGFSLGGIDALDLSWGFMATVNAAFELMGVEQPVEPQVSANIQTTVTDK